MLSCELSGRVALYWHVCAKGTLFSLVSLMVRILGYCHVLKSPEVFPLLWDRFQCFTSSLIFALRSYSHASPTTMTIIRDIVIMILWLVKLTSVSHRPACSTEQGVPQTSVSQTIVSHRPVCPTDQCISQTSVSHRSVSHRPAHGSNGETSPRCFSPLLCWTVFTLFQSILAQSTFVLNSIHVISIHFSTFVLKRIQAI